VCLPLRPLLLLAFLVTACSNAAHQRALKEQMPPYAYLVVDVPRREAKGVIERWAVAARPEKGAFLVHASDVERRRTRQTCGGIPLEKFVPGWEALQAQGLLQPVEDYRLMPKPGAPPFAARLQLRYAQNGREAIARRPLERGELDSLLGVLRPWESALLLVKPEQIPAELRVEIGMEGCGPKPRRPQAAPGADTGTLAPARPPY
jgi:hypothetical protein